MLKMFSNVLAINWNVLFRRIKKVNSVMPPKRAASGWGNVIVERGALVTCSDACAHELMMRLNIDSGDTMIHTPLADQKFFVRQSMVEAFSLKADELLNPLGRKRPRAQKIDGDAFDEDVDEY